MHPHISHASSLIPGSMGLGGRVLGLMWSLLSCVFHDMTKREFPRLVSSGLCVIITCLFRSSTI